MKTQKTLKMCSMKTIICSLNFVFFVFFMFFRKKKKNGNEIYFHFIVFENIKQFSKIVNKHALGNRKENSEENKKLILYVYSNSFYLFPFII